VTQAMSNDKAEFQKHLVSIIDDKVPSLVEFAKANHQQQLLSHCKSFLPNIGILLHLKVCCQYSDFANHEVLQYTLLPQLDECTDFSFLEGLELKSEAL